MRTAAQPPSIAPVSWRLPRRALLSSLAPAISLTSKQTTLQAALDTAAPGDTLLIPGGWYSERLVIRGNVSLAAEPGATVVLEWTTTRPYESTIQALPGVTTCITGVRIVHNSPSVANNYAVYNQAGNVTLRSCDIGSDSGSGVGSDGGVLVVDNSCVCKCKRSGVVCGGDFNGEPAVLTVRGCRLDGNGLHGLVLLEGTAAQVTDSVCSSNAGLGIQLQDGELDLSQSRVSGNGKGSIYVGSAAALRESERNVIIPGAVRAR